MRWLVPLLALGLALSGCFTDEDGDAKNSPSPDATGQPDTSATPPPSPGASPSPSPTPGPSRPPGVTNRLPSASLEAAFEADALPVEVEFTVKATDADNDPLSWTLDFGDGNATEGDELPATLTHAYGRQGEFRAVLNVSDGTDTVQRTVTIDTTLDQDPVQVLEASWERSNGHCFAAIALDVPSDLFFPDPLEGQTFASFDVDPDSHGLPFRVDFTYPDGAVGGATFTDADGGYLQRTVTSEDGQEAAAVHGEVPDGAARAFLFSCLADPEPTTGAYQAGPAVA